MDYIHIQMKSEATRLPLPLDVMVPRGRDRGPYKTVYLLHDIGGNQSWWSRNTAIESLLEDAGAVLVMPSCLNSFYVNNYYGSDFFEYVAHELVYYCEHWLNLDRKREKRMIAGVGMGGYGAIYSALEAPEVFGHAVSIRGMLEPQKYYDDPLPKVRMEDIFGPKEYFAQSPFELKGKMERFEREHIGVSKPQLTYFNEEADVYNLLAEKVKAM